MLLIYEYVPHAWYGLWKHKNLYLSILILFLNSYNMLHYLDSLKVEE
jgi:hypothetical protein